MAYSTLSDLQLVYGSNNVSKWADANNNASAGEITARVAWAIAKADSYIDDKLRRKWHELPFSPVPTTIKELSAQLAGVILYRSPRGLVDGDDSNAVMQDFRDECETMLVNILAGVVKLDYEIQIASHPAVYIEEE